MQKARKRPLRVPQYFGRALAANTVRLRRDDRNSLPTDARQSPHRPTVRLPLRAPATVRLPPPQFRLLLTRGRSRVTAAALFCTASSWILWDPPIAVQKIQMPALPAAIWILTIRPNVPHYC